MQFKLTDSKTIKIRNDFDLDSDQLFGFLELFLNEIGVLTKIERNKIVFRSIRGSTTNFGENINEAIRIIREGEVKLIKLNDNRIKLKWEVRLNILLFWSILFGIMMSFLSYIIAPLFFIEENIPGPSVFISEEFF